MQGRAARVSISLVPSQRCSAVRLSLGARETPQTARAACGECYAEFTGQPCWELWAARLAAAKPCCRKEERCEVCPVFQARTVPQPVEAGGVPEPGIPAPSQPAPRSIRVCPSLRVSTLPAGDPDDLGYVSLVRTTLRTDAAAECRCMARGAALVADYVRAVCVSAEVDDCAFRDPDTDLETPAVQPRPHA